MKKYLSVIISIIIAVLPMMLLVSCDAEPQKTKFNAHYFDYFDTATIITGYEETQEDFDEVCKEITALLHEYHRLYTIYNRYEGLNNLVTINDLVDGKHTVVTVDKRIIDNIRGLAIDMIDNANSGHPGIALGAAPIITTLYNNHMVINPKDEKWINRDRFILSAGHGSSLLYATLYMAGYDISLDDLKEFRKIDSKTPGHPELNITPGVDISTGPLGQGIASSVGIAIGEKYLEKYFGEEAKKDIKEVLKIVFNLLPFIKLEYLIIKYVIKAIFTVK